MGEETVLMLIQSMNIMNYLIMGLLLLGTLLLWRYNTKSNDPIYHTLFYYFLINVFFKLISKLYFYFQADEGITNFPYFSLLNNIVHYCFFYYFICYKLKIKTKAITYFQLLSLPILILFTYEMYESSFTNIYTQVSYTPVVVSVTICAMLLVYLFEMMIDRLNRENPFFLLVLIFLSFFSIEIIYLVSENYMVNHILQNNDVFLFLFSKIFFEVAFSAFLTIFVIKETLGFSRKTETV